ncbi:class III poly(R)-hydroxyalkanoic acid synthase subunit PhaE [Stenotrophomonas sp. C3(2023)]|uniref:class III poly(R)-hydroxyalkanoic acid synthase subunit PhaE n=1 Tax=Stenotrophomonas sp. C3(2023) TaxID=3080277 RepID=UPI00293CC3AC|nr:class III poly(R)-hydroxyalkanoic acid synthase subunit PhaE [Stenotrophomonas sp. C3(2023)]MDV3468518.1 class III poly(R)-hydroxyalkanoic acid synthase subunit PhaE [Stenotrophomonas sp. C3(2023)]
MNNEGGQGGTGFDPRAQQYFAAWSEALRHAGHAGAAAAPGSNNPGDWKQVLDWWSQLLPERNPGVVDDALHRFGNQAGGWYSTMQGVAARFTGRDTTSAEVAAAWREAVMGGEQGEALLDWMLGGARRTTGAAGDGMDMAALLQQWQQHLAPWLQGPAFGPGREHQARWQTLLRAQQDYQDQSKAYIEQIRKALDEAFALFEQRLAEHEAPGTQLTSARAMFDLWIEVAEEAYAKVALSDAFQSVYAALGNAQMRLRAAMQQEVEQVSERVGLPTRTEMDAAHRRIAELERQLRRLQATVAGLASGAVAAESAAPDPWQQAAQPAAAKVTPRRARATGAGATASKAATGAAAKAQTGKPAKKAAKAPDAATARPRSASRAEEPGRATTGRRGARR